LLDEINGLRSHAGLPPRDQEQFLSGLIDRFPASGGGDS
jgi:hypothetical protein